MLAGRLVCWRDVMVEETEGDGEVGDFLYSFFSDCVVVTIHLLVSFRKTFHPYTLFYMSYRGGYSLQILKIFSFFSHVTTFYIKNKYTDIFFL